MELQRSGPRFFLVSSVLLMVVLGVELFSSVRNQSQTFDESAHLYAGYTYWKTHDFGINPEHPPLAKVVAAIPLLPLHVPLASPPKMHFRPAAVLGGRALLYKNDADMLLFRSRVTISVFTFALALLVLFAAREMFGWQTSLIALVLLVFEPNILANGALVTTDMAVTAMIFGTIYTFYRYLKQPTWARLLVCGGFAGLTLTVKHSGLLVFPMLLAVLIVDLLITHASTEAPRVLMRRGAGRIVSLLAIAALSLTVLWAAYGFHYSARPNAAAMIPAAPAFLQTLHSPRERAFISFAERHHLLPEAYLYGLTDIMVDAGVGRPTYLFGKAYVRGQWFYFPSTFVIKSTIGFLLMLAIALAAAGLWRRERQREALAMLVPAAVYLVFAMNSRLDIGHRHILPIYPFLIVLAAAGVWILARQARAWAIAVMALLLFHAVSSMRAYPAYLPYSNEFWGGPSKTYRVLGDSNVGWSTGLHTMQRYVADRHITQCWFAYFGPADLSYFHLPCKPLPTFFSILLDPQKSPVAESIQGPIFVSSENFGALWQGPLDRSPYWSFKDRTPDAVLDGEILVFNGIYDARAVSALSHFALARNAVSARHPDVAMTEAQRANALDPNQVGYHEMLAQLYADAHQFPDARREYNFALQLYQAEYAANPDVISPPTDPVPVASVASAEPAAKQQGSTPR